VDGLQEAGYQVCLAHTLGLYMITGAKVNTDRRDALAVAKLLKASMIPKAYIYPKDTRPDRVAVAVPFTQPRSSFRNLARVVPAGDG
jgi:hypothetical protein